MNRKLVATCSHHSRTTPARFRSVKTNLAHCSAPTPASGNGLTSPRYTNSEILRGPLSGQFKSFICPSMPDRGCAALADLNEMREALEREWLNELGRLAPCNGFGETFATHGGRLESPCAPARVDEIILDRREPHDGAEIGRHVRKPRPLPHHFHLGKERKELEHVTHEAFLELQGRARGIKRIGVGRTAHHELAARALRDIDVQAAGHDDGIE